METYKINGMVFRIEEISKPNRPDEYQVFVSPEIDPEAGFFLPHWTEKQDTWETPGGARGGILEFLEKNKTYP